MVSWLSGGFQVIYQRARRQSLIFNHGINILTKKFKEIKERKGFF
jgi:hypothetical protein